MGAARAAAPRCRVRRAPGRRASPRPASAAWVLGGRWSRSAPSAWLRSAPRNSRLAQPARPYFYPPPSVPAPVPAPARRDSGSRRALAPSPQRHSPRDQAGGRDRRGPAGRGGVSPPPPLGPEASPGSPGRPASGRRRRAAAREVPRAPTLRPARAAWSGRRRLPSGRGAGAAVGRAEALGASVPSPRTRPPPCGTGPTEETPGTCPQLGSPAPGEGAGAGGRPREGQVLVETPHHAGGRASGPRHLSGSRKARTGGLVAICPPGLSTKHSCAQIGVLRK